MTQYSFQGQREKERFETKPIYKVMRGNNRYTELSQSPLLYYYSINKVITLCNLKSHTLILVVHCQTSYPVGALQDFQLV